MDVTPLIPVGRQIIQNYRTGSFRISGKNYNGPVIVMPEKTMPWPVSSPLTATSFSALLPMARDLDIVLVGVGGEQIFIPPAMRQILKEQGLMIDVMETGAACRTYNVLMAEGRRLAAALLPV